MTIGESIRNLRKEKGLSQTELANELHLSQDTISLWETDKSKPDATSIVALALFFDVTTDEILCFADFKNKLKR